MPLDPVATAISPIEEILADARAGKMFVLVDHEDRENEGDLVIPASFATPEAINFMARHGRGLICLALTADRVDALGLKLMVSNNASRHETAFTVSIEAREGITTGISAHDRARTVAVAIDPGKTGADIATPGHVFPLRARDGGVLVRAGHTEAAVDVARLAGLPPAGVICEIMKEDGSMARLPDLIRFAAEHDLRIGTISDLIAYRLRTDSLVTETESRAVTSAYGGEWQMRVFLDRVKGAEHIALTKGDVGDGRPVLVRMHVLDPVEDVLGVRSRGFDLAEHAMRDIAEAGRGVMVLLRDTRMKLDRTGGTAPTVVRDYGVGAQILAALGVHEIDLLTKGAGVRPIALDGYDLSIRSVRQIT
ncbi:3,4-dihydroxy-2-butanone-4-phosphate synthase [Wenxinia marina]|uniref:3,4-dihydroxy-2-butanone 4-phosphate synthase n=1 Tax=Wenxinia marina DSM 24838 TaxID=1123501 RepID=A0A0D0QBJ6_9RHOB|nr:3,4-dihydroxy-2-butanone-4-phosphate synthase [Wenxinia marina]KIQ68318.1 3,4-dihydroxy-2-butanone 4-phosphate synthase [Wenxinia marina DSM 24838]GGL79692.1 3,4-dihydroxy-2-butanone 4-phosphate synthase [Wenxinia marina]